MLNTWLKKFLFLDMSNYERTKIFLLTTAFFLLIGSYTIGQTLKDSIFVSVVGKEYIPLAKQISMIILIPLIFIYSKLVDTLRRSQLLYVYCWLYGILGLIFTYFIGHPLIGISNTDASPFRFFGWFFYFYLEGYAPFLISLLWAFTNSITNSEAAKNTYAIMVSGSKVGGMAAALLGWGLFTWQSLAGKTMFTEIVTHQVLMGFAATLLLVVPFMVYSLMRLVPGKFLHGYEAAYQVEKEKSKAGKEKPGIFSGLIMVLKYPYVMGIFGMVFFYDVINVVINYQRISVAQLGSSTVSGLSSTLFMHQFWMHSFGLLISFFGTRALMNKLGIRRCLLLIPVLVGVLVTIFILGSSNSWVILSVLIILRSLNYAFNWPVRESLYIPTVKEMKFKSKSWIDAFGSKFAKAFGSSFNRLTIGIGAPGSPLFSMVYASFFATMTLIWFVVAYLLGHRYSWALEHDEVIGAETEEKTAAS